MIYQPFSEYLTVNAESSSGLKTMLRSPAHYWEWRNNPVDMKTTAKNFGTAAHCVNVEHNSDMLAIIPECDRRTKAGKELFAAFQESASGKTIVTQEEYDTIMAMRQSILCHRWARTMLEKGLPEQSHFWNDAETGLPCKCRFDRIYETLIVDYKTTQDASPHGFQKAAMTFGYHLQAAHYTDSIPGAQFVFICQEKEAPYAVACYQADGEFLAYGRSERARLMKQIAECRESGIWPGYLDGIQMLYLPAWVKGRTEND